MSFLLMFLSLLVPPLHVKLSPLMLLVRKWPITHLTVVAAGTIPEYCSDYAATCLIDDKQVSSHPATPYEAYVSTPFELRILEAVCVKQQRRGWVLHQWSPTLSRIWNQVSPSCRTKNTSRPPWFNPATPSKDDI